MKKFIIIVIWIGLWFVLSLLIHNPVLFAAPSDTLKALVTFITEESFWISVLKTFVLVIAGLLTASVTAAAIAFFSYRYNFFREFIRPFIQFMKSTPVACFIVLFLIWFGSGKIAFYAVITAVMPQIYVAIMEGIGAADHKLLEVAEIYKMSSMKKFRYAIFPTLKGYLISAYEIVLGMSFKSGVAAEVVGQSVNTIGNGIYRSKIYLDTAGLFAWSFVIILISYLFEKVCIILIRRMK